MVTRDERPTSPAASPVTRSAFMDVTGLQLTSVSAEGVEGFIELGPDQHQPFGIVHGGVYASAVEEAASMGAAAFAATFDMTAVGVANTTNFLRSMSSGRVDVRATPMHQGRTQQLWEVRITDCEARLVSLGQVRLQNIQPRS